MQVEDLILVSTDDHVVEPPSLTDFFADRVPAKFRDRVPRVVRRADGSDAWLIEGKEIATFARLCPRPIVNVARGGLTAPGFVWR